MHLFVCYGFGNVLGLLKGIMDYHHDPEKNNPLRPDFFLWGGESRVSSP